MGRRETNGWFEKRALLLKKQTLRFGGLRSPFLSRHTFIHSTMADDNKQQALAEKELGNQAYKKKQFEEALSHYEKAWSLDDTNISILTNKAGMCFLSWIEKEI